MNHKIIRPISQNEIEQFDHDGVILLKEMFDSEWISTLSQGLDKNIDLPSNRSRLWDRDENGRTMFYDAQAWQKITEYQNFIFNSPAAAMLVLTNILPTALASSIVENANWEPPLKKNHPNHRIKVPNATRGIFEPGIFCGLPFSSYFPCRGPIIMTDARAAIAPAIWTIPEPAKSIKQCLRPYNRLWGLASMYNLDISP